MKNFKKIAIITLIISSISIGIGLLILYESEYSIEDFITEINNFIHMNDTNINRNNIIYVDEEYKYDTEDETILDIDSKVSNIKIKTSKSNQIVIKTEGKLNKKYKNNYISINNHKNKIKIEVLKYAYKNSLNLNSEELKVQIIIPEKIFKEINFETVSGDIDINDINIEKIRINTKSGDIALDKSEIDEVKCNLFSGNFKSEAIINNLNLKSSSGDIELSNVNSANIETVSGNINIKYNNNLFKENHLKTISGNIIIYFYQLPGTDIIIKESSGRINYNNKNIKNNYKNSLPYRDKDKINSLIIETTSGNIDIFDEKE